MRQPQGSSVIHLLEWVFVEGRRQKKTITNAFGEKPMLKLMFYATYLTVKRWCALKVIVSNDVRWCPETGYSLRQFFRRCAPKEIF